MVNKFFSRCFFANTNLPENRYKIYLGKTGLKELQEDSFDTFEKSMLD